MNRRRRRALRVLVGATAAALLLQQYADSAGGLTTVFTDITATQPYGSMKIIDGVTLANNWETSSSLTPFDKLVHSRSSNAMCYGSDGLLRYAPHNLWFNSANSAAFGEKSAGATVTGGISDPLGGTAATQLDFASQFDYAGRVNSNIPSGSKIQSIWVKGDSAGTITLRGASGGNWSTQVNVTTNWTRVYTAVFTYSGFETISVYRNTGDLARVYVAFPMLEVVTDATTPSAYVSSGTSGSAVYKPRIEYNPADVSDIWGFLTEEQRTNLATNNMAPATLFSTLSAGSLGAGGASSIAGYNYSRFTPAASNAPHYAQAGSFTVASGSVYSGSVEVQYTTHSHVAIGCYDNTGGWQDSAIFNIATGAKITNGGFSHADILPLGNGRYRLTFTRTTASTGVYYTVGTVAAGTVSYNNSASWSATGSEVVDFTAFQLELGACATSVIITGAATATRSIDNLSIDTSQFNWNNTLHTIFLEGLKRDTVARTWSPIIGDNAGIVYQFHYSYGGGGTTPYVITGTLDANMTAVSTYNNGLKNKIAFALSSPNDASGCVNGTTPVSDVSGTVGTSPTKFWFGNNGLIGGYSSGNGHIRKIMILPRRAPGAELQSMTT